MSERKWVDESFSEAGFRKSLTGEGSTSIDYSRIGATESGELQLITPASSSGNGDAQCQAVHPASNATEGTKS